MTQEDKELLLKDLCARLPYGVKCKILETNKVKILGSIQYDDENTLFDFWENYKKIQYDYQLCLTEFKPYLFPLSSMTEEQKRTYNIISLDADWVSNPHYNVPAYNVLDWLNNNRLDYRGLIDKGLAIDATGLNIY